MSKRKTSETVSLKDIDNVPSLRSLPLLRNVLEEELRQDIFYQKLRICREIPLNCKRSRCETATADYWSNTFQSRENLLLELIEYVNVTSDGFNENTVGCLVQLMEQVVSRDVESSWTSFSTAFSKTADKNDGIFEEVGDFHIDNQLWSVYQLIYELFLQVISKEQLDTRSCLKHVNQVFLSKLFFLLVSRDVRERDYLKTIIHRIYQRFVRHRHFIRDQMAFSMYQLAFERRRFCGMPEMLEILCSIIRGFATPLKDEHKNLLFRFLMQMHHDADLEEYFPQFVSCIQSYLLKDASLIPYVLRMIIRMWPKCNSMKEILYLNEVEVILQIVDEKLFPQVSDAVLHRVGKCIACPHFQVAERALYLWRDDHIVKLIATNRQDTHFIVVKYLTAAIECHWCPSVIKLAKQVKQLFIEVDPEFFREVFGCSSSQMIATEETNEMSIRQSMGKTVTFSTCECIADSLSSKDVPLTCIDKAVDPV
eukprot:jgi/Galph1/1334/GphlegSOOS_G6046.1